MKKLIFAAFLALLAYPAQGKQRYSPAFSGGVRVSSYAPVAAAAAGGGCSGTFPDAAVLDDFNRTENPLANGAWINGNIISGVTDKMQADGTQATQQQASGWADQAYGTMFTTGTHEVYATVATQPATDRIRLFCKVDSATGASAGYELFWRGDTEVAGVFLVVAGADGTGIGTTWSQALTDGDTWGMRCSNDASGTITVYRSGTEVASRTDTTYKDRAGYIGMGTNGNDTRLDNFGGGTCP